MNLELLRNYAKELRDMIKSVKDLTIPSVWANVYGEITFLERFCHSNGLKKEIDIIWAKYEGEIKKEFDKQLEIDLEGLGIGI